MECPSCEAKIEGDWLICPSCGLDLVPVNYTLLKLNSEKVIDTQAFEKSIILDAERNKNKINNKRYFFVALAFSMILAAGFWLPSSKAKSTASTSIPIKMLDSTNTPIPKITFTPRPSPTYPPLPEFSVRYFDEEKDGNLKNFWSESFIPDFSWATFPGEYFWELTYLSDTPILIYNGWCALDRDTLEKNLAVSKFVFVVDGYEITESLEMSDDTAQMLGKEWVCRNYLGVVENLDKGKHSIIYSHIVYQALNDGLDNYNVGSYAYNFTINIP